MSILNILAEKNESYSSATPQHRVVTARMSRELHERAKNAAHAAKISLNLLCVVAIEQAVKEIESAQAQNKEGAAA